MRCPYCDKVMTQGPQPKRPKGVKKSAFRPVLRAYHESARTREHMVPRCQGGNQWVYACGACNQDKGDLTLFEYRVVLSIRRRVPVIFAFEWAALRGLLTSALCTLSRWRIA